MPIGLIWTIWPSRSSTRSSSCNTPDPDLRAIRARAAVGTDISSHLEALYVAGLAAHPRLIVELGVRGGESTFVFERVARRAGADLVSVDIADCSTVSRYERWHWVQDDDVRLGGQFRSWCAEHGLEPLVDVLFVDTNSTSTSGSRPCSAHQLRSEGDTSELQS